MLLIARTDSESGKLISSNVDITDHEFIVGTITKGSRPLAQVLAEAEAKGATGAEVDRLEKEWTESHEMCTFNQGKLSLAAHHLFLISSSCREGDQQVEHPGQERCFEDLPFGC